MINVGELIKIKLGKNRSKYIMGIVEMAGTTHGGFSFTIKGAPKQTRADKMIKRLKR